MSDRIFDIGGAGIDAADERVKSMMNNLVNAETPGFRKTDVVQKAFPLELEAAEKRLSTMKPMVEAAYYDHLHGALVRTGNPTDMAIGGDGFFVVAAPWGDGYTRDGRFIVNNNGELVSLSGNYQLMGQKGPIVVPPGSSITISNAGEVKVGDVVVDRIRVVQVPDTATLDSVSGAMFRATDSTVNIEEVSSPNMIQGYVESSNVSMMDEMMNMVTISHLYDVNVKLIQTRDASLASADTMGKPTQ